MTFPFDIAVGTRVRYTAADHSTLVLGDLGTFVGKNTYGDYAILMDDGRGRSAIDFNGLNYHWTTGGRNFEVVPTGPVVGETYIVVADNYSDDPHGMALGTSVTIYKADPDRDGRIIVRRNTEVAFTYYVLPPDIGIVSAPEVTLESFRLSFLTGAVARGVANGETHSAQVTEALDNLARVEFLEPSKTLEDFQKRIVSLAMDAKGKHKWCGEPEKYLTEIGLKHLLPVRKSIKVITEVQVSGDPSWDQYRFNDEATKIAAATTTAHSFWTE